MIPALFSWHMPYFQTGLTPWIDAVYSPQTHNLASEKDFKIDLFDNAKSIRKIVLADNTGNEKDWGFSLCVLLGVVEQDTLFYIASNRNNKLNVSEETEKQFFAMLLAECESFSKVYPKSERLGSHWKADISRREKELQAYINHP